MVCEVCTSAGSKLQVTCVWCEEMQLLQMTQNGGLLKRRGRRRRGGRGEEEEEGKGRRGGGGGEGEEGMV